MPQTPYQKGGLEERLWTLALLVANDLLPIRPLLTLLQGGGGGGGVCLLFEVQGDRAELFLDVFHKFLLSDGGEAVASLPEDLHEVVCRAPASQVRTQDGMGEGVALVDGHSVGDPIPSPTMPEVQPEAHTEGQHSPDGHVHGRSVEAPKRNLSQKQF